MPSFTSHFIRRRVPYWAFCWFAALISAGTIAPQRVRGELVRFEILEREPVANGKSYGDAGPYERIVGRLHFRFDPQLERNRQIVDLPLASREEDDRVAVTADFFLLAPTDPSRSCGALLYDVNNRGNKLALQFFNDAPGGNNPLNEADLGNGFLMRHGYVIAWSGWDGELLPAEHRLRLQAPVARGSNGSMRGLVRCEFVPPPDTHRMIVNWDNHGSYRPAPGAEQQATLTVRQRPEEPRHVVARDQWQLIVTEVDRDDPRQLPRIEVEIPTGMKAGYLYELIYEARDPLVMGCGLAAVRDFVSALKHGTGENNPLVVDGRSVVRRAHGFGVSQSGRFLREFLYAGFNADEQGNRVFDGLMPHVSGGGLGSFNHRFAQPTRHASQHDHDDYLPDRFPFTYEVTTDPYTGRTDGLLRRARQDGVEPLVVHTQSSAEYWTRSGSLVHTDPAMRYDVDVPQNVRIFAFGGTQHGPASFPPAQGNGTTLANPGDYRPLLRALLLGLDRWAAGGEPAPPSVYPRLDQGTLVDWHQAATGFPDIPAIEYPQVIRRPPILDLGPRWSSQFIIDQQPPQILARYRVGVARCDADGNELGCLLPPEVAVPLATHTGWNLRNETAGAAGQLVSLVGSYIPFPRTAELRRADGDPRQSIDERYGDRAQYLEQLQRHCEQMVEAGLLLAEDVDGIVARQAQRWPAP